VTAVSQSGVAGHGVPTELVPTTTDEVTAEFLTVALRSSGVIGEDSSVAEVEHDRIGEGVGLMCELARLTLRYAGPAHGAPSSVILKVPSNFPANRNIGNHFRLYEREGRFYELLASAVPVRTPECLVNCIDVDNGLFALVLEDFGSRTMVSQVVGLDASRASEAVRALGRLHARFWEAPELEELVWMPRAIDPEVLGAGQSYREAWPVFHERFHDDLPDGGAELAELVGSTWEDLALSTYDDTPRTVCHGDFRADNLMFDDTTTGEHHVGVLDWQVSMRGPGIGDVGYFLAQSLTSDVRRAHQRELVEQWYEELSTDLGGEPEGYSFDDAWEDYRRSTASMTALPVIGGAQTDLANERGLQLMREMAQRAFSAAIELEAGSLLGR
jgi:aminoglycoside phosphotransferase (APT) family kinase protein